MYKEEYLALVTEFIENAMKMKNDIKEYNNDLLSYTYEFSIEGSKERIKEN